MFELSEDEIDAVVSQTVIPSKQFLGGAKPFAFTETGVAMLSSVLKSKRAKEMNVAIMRAFIGLRKMLSDKSMLHLEVMEIKKKLEGHDKSIDLVFKYLDELIGQKNMPEIIRKRIGYKPEK